MRTADFERVLATAPRSRSAHFAAHHLAAPPLQPGTGSHRTRSTELSTATAPLCALPVDQLPDGWWLGLVVPKRHARRAVTRNLVKRQMRAVMTGVVVAAATAGQPVCGLARGLWVLRLKAPFDRGMFRSAASAALRVAVRDELGQLLARATRA